MELSLGVFDYCWLLAAGFLWFETAFGSEQGVCYQALLFVMNLRFDKVAQPVVVTQKRLENWRLASVQINIHLQT